MIAHDIKYGSDAVVFLQAACQVCVTQPCGWKVFVKLEEIDAPVTVVAGLAQVVGTALPGRGAAGE